MELHGRSICVTCVHVIYARVLSAKLGGNVGLTKSGTDTLTLSGANTYSGTTTVTAGTLIVSNTSGSGTGTGSVTVNSGGALGGTGAISGWVAVTLGGHLAPGASIGTLNAGRVSMMENSIYEWELGATTADKVAVAGDLTLYNGWKVLLMNGGGAPRPGTEYDLFTYTGAAGLGTYTIDAGSTGWDVYDATIVNDAGGKRLYITGLALLGDTNSDGVVDAADYIALKQNFGLGSGATRAQGDFNHDNQVNWTDLQLLMSNFGTRSVGGVPATTPEPATLSLLALGGLAVIRRRRRVVGPHAAVVNQSPARGPSRFPTPNQISYQFVPLALEPS